MLAQKIALNTLWQVLGKILTLITGLAVIMILTRSLGTVGFGGFTTITAYLQFFGIIVDFGLTLIGAQMLSTTIFSKEKTFNNIFTIKVISSFIVFGIAVILAWFTNYPQLVKVAITIASLSFILNAIQQVFVGWYQKNLIIAKLALAEIISKVVMLAGITTVVFLGGGLLALMPILILTSFVYLFFTLAFIYTAYRPRFAFDWEVWREIASRSWPIALGILFNLIYLKADTIILSLTRSQAEVGVYGASFRILEVIITFPMMLLGLLLPQMTSAWNNQRDYWKLIYQKTYDVINVIIWPLAFGGALIAKDVMLLIAGQEFKDSAVILQILLLSLVAIFLSTLFGHLIISMNKQIKSIWAYGATAGLALFFYFMFIPQFGFWAAAIITLAAELLIATLTYLVVGFLSNFWPNQRIFWTSIISALIMYFILSSQNFNWYLNIITGSLLYTLLLLLILQKTPGSLLKHFKY